MRKDESRFIFADEMVKRPPSLPALAADEKLPAAPQQARSIEKRRTILEAARRLFAEKGYEATSIEEITSEAKTASGAFYTYFRSKRQLLLVLMDELLQRLSAADLQPKGAVNVQSGLRRFLDEVFRTDLEFFGVIRAWQEAALEDAELGAMQEKIEEWTGARILRLVESLQQSPNARPHADLAPFARMMDRHFWSLLARASRLTPRDFRRELELAADVIYHYMFRD